MDTKLSERSFLSALVYGRKISSNPVYKSSKWFSFILIFIETLGRGFALNFFFFIRGLYSSVLEFVLLNILYSFSDYRTPV